jgi:KDO2-lipid IV(A) lauroyltransferase
MWLLGKTPRGLGLALSGPLGWLLARSMKGRRRIARRNLERCFPELDGKRREMLINGCFRSIGRMPFEIAWGWSASAERMRRMGRCEGLPAALGAYEEQRGLLLITAHVTCLEIGARLAALELPRGGGIYRPLRSPVLEWYQNRNRGKYYEALISKRDLRSAIRHLKGGGVLWYAPDQDFGPRQSLFVPFFGIPAATLTATARLVKLTGCRVVPMFPRYDEATRQYVVQFQPALENFPTGDIVADLTRVNAMLEEQVRKTPEQYWWIHRRFKTRPEGEPPFYDGSEGSPP